MKSNRKPGTIDLKKPMRYLCDGKNGTAIKPVLVKNGQLMTK